jgi:hypothetical protein
LVSAPRRVTAAVAVSSTALSLAASDADDATSSVYAIISVSYESYIRTDHQ